MLIVVGVCRQLRTRLGSQRHSRRKKLRYGCATLAILGMALYETCAEFLSGLFRLDQIRSAATVSALQSAGRTPGMRKLIRNTVEYNGHVQQ